MAADIAIIELNGASATPTDKTSGTVRFKKADDATVDLNDPLVVPSSNTEYSYLKVLRLRDNGDAYTQISNIRAYTDGSAVWQAGVKAWAATDGVYTQPYIPTVTNDPPQYSSDGAAGSPQTTMVDLFSYTSGAPLDMDAFDAGPFTPGSPAEFIGDFMYMAMEVEIGSTQGLQTAETLTFSWDEI